MIYDCLSNIHKYQSLSPYMEYAIPWIKEKMYHNLPEGKHVIYGEHVFVLMQNQRSKQRKNCLWESHKKYIDIQILL